MTASFSATGTNHHTSDNHVLAMLPEEDQDRIRGHLELVKMPSRLSFHDASPEMEYVYFPVDTIVSLLCTQETGDSAEIAVVGFEGMVGISLFMGGESAVSHAVTQSDGYAYRMPGTIFRDEFHRAETMQYLLLRYSRALLAQIVQIVTCNQQHTLDQQLCRSLLLSHDRRKSGELVTTRELISDMFGVGREWIDETLDMLRGAGVVDCDRERITIGDRTALEAHACDCYHAVKREYQRLLALTPAH